MQRQAPENSLVRRARLLIYRIVLPGGTIFTLLVLAGQMPRPLFLESRVWDLGARLWLSLVYLANFNIVADIRKYERWIYGSRYAEGERDSATTLWNVVMGVMLFLFVWIMTHWSVQTFLPSLGDYATILAALYGLVSALPLLLLRRR